MRAVDVIRTKRDGGVLSPEAIASFVRGVVDGSWPDYQASALLMAIVLRGMTAAETADLTQAMLASGERVDLSALPGLPVGKHSTGGVGDKVSIVLAPLVAACGITVPKMSGRGLGHTGGTLDKLEAIPGFRTTLSVEEFRAALADVGCAIIGQTGRIVPADRALYALRDVTATVEPAAHRRLDHEQSSPRAAARSCSTSSAAAAPSCGRAEALAIARALVALGAANGVPTEAVISRMDEPLGGAVGNALEVRECVATLRGHGPAPLARLVTALAARMLCLGGVASSQHDAARVRSARASGAALQRFAAMVARQGGEARLVEDDAVLPVARRRVVVPAPRTGFVHAIDAARIGRASMCLGAGRERAGDPIDPAVGVVFLVDRGAAVRAGDPLMELHVNDESRLDEARALAGAGIDIADAPPAALPIILDWVRA